MPDKFHYDAAGKFTGRTSDTPPPSAGGVGCLAVIVLAVAAGMCNSKGSNAGSEPGGVNSGKDRQREVTFCAFKDCAETTKADCPSPGKYGRQSRCEIEKECILNGGNCYPRQTVQPCGTRLPSEGTCANERLACCAY